MVDVVVVVVVVVVTRSVVTRSVTTLKNVVSSIPLFMSFERPDERNKKCTIKNQGKIVNRAIHIIRNTLKQSNEFKK